MFQRLRTLPFLQIGLASALTALLAVFLGVGITDAVGSVHFPLWLLIVIILFSVGAIGGIALWQQASQQNTTPSVPSVPNDPSEIGEPRAASGSFGLPASSTRDLAPTPRVASPSSTLPLASSMALAALPFPGKLIGRQQELGHLLTKLCAVTSATTQEPGSAIALRGMGGIGKTALAATALRQLASEGAFPDGLLVIPCERRAEPAAILGSILLRLGVAPQRPEETSFDALSDLVRTLVFGKRILLVLDNVEPELPLEQIVSCWTSAGGMALITARQQLPADVIPFDATFVVGPLAEDAALELFFTAANQPIPTTQAPARRAAQRILAVLGRHTLATKLAGCLLAEEGRSVSALAADFEREPTLGLQLPDDQTTNAVEIVLAKSIHHLTDEGQRLFAGLASLPTRECGRHAALALAQGLGLSDPPTALRQLIRLALIEPTSDTVGDTINATNDERTDGRSGDHERLRIHPLVFELMAQPGIVSVPIDRASVTVQLAQYYADYACATADDALLPDVENCERMLAWAVGVGREDLISQYCAGLKRYWRERGYADKLIRYLPLGIAALENLLAKITISPVALGGDSATAPIPDDADPMNEVDEVATLPPVQLAGSGASVDTATARKTPLERAQSFLAAFYLDLGYGYKMQSKMEQAEDWTRRALHFVRQTQQAHSEGVTLGQLGQIAQDSGHPEQARAWYEQSWALRASLGDQQGLAILSSRLGLLDMEEGQLESARGHLARVVEIFRSLGDTYDLGIAVSRLAQLALRQGDWDQAEIVTREGLALREAAGDRLGVSQERYMLGLIALRQGRDDLAETLLTQSLEEARDLDDLQGVGATLSTLAELALQREDEPRARALLAESLPIRRAAQDHQGEGVDLTRLAQTALMRGEYERARATLDEALPIVRACHDRMTEAAILDLFAKLAEQAGDPARAEEYHRASLAISQEIGDRGGEHTSLVALSLLLLRQADRQEEGRQLALALVPPTASKQE